MVWLSVSEKSSYVSDFYVKPDKDKGQATTHPREKHWKVRTDARFR